MGNFFSDIFKGTDDSLKMVQVPQSEQAEEARKRLYEKATSRPPEVPLAGVAPPTEMGEERETARATAMEMIQPQELFDLPEVQGILDRTIKEGNLIANRLGRSLQNTGNFTSTTGRDVLGRTVQDVESNLSATLAPFAMQHRQMRANLIPVLEQLGITEEEQKRLYNQDLLNAIYQKEIGELNLESSYTIPLLQSVIENQPEYMSYVKQGKPSILSQVAPIIGMALGGYMMGGAGMAGAAGAAGAAKVGGGNYGNARNY